MRCDFFWKRIVTLCLTFWLGVFVSDLFVSKDLPPIVVFDATSEEKVISGNKEPTRNLMSKKRICVPADVNLKYRFLNGIEKSSAPAGKLKEKTGENKNITQENNELRPIKSDKKQKIIEELEKQLYKSSEDRALYQNLLHKEKCYESNGRK